MCIVDDVDEKIVGLELTIALANVGLGVMLAGTVAFDAGRWWVGVLVAVCTGLLLAAADRSRTGLRALWIAGGVSVVAIAWAWYADAMGLIPIGLVGLSVGFGLNRFLFGVVRPVPSARRQRERSA